jgi:hypothetical protein
MRDLERPEPGRSDTMTRNETDGGAKDPVSRSYAGMTRIRFKGSVRTISVPCGTPLEIRGKSDRASVLRQQVACGNCLDSFRLFERVEGFHSLLKRQPRGAHLVA